MVTPGKSEQASQSRQREWSAELRGRFLGIGMIAVAAACLLFAVARFAVQWRTGLLTPWMFNAAGFIAIAGLYLWYRRAPVKRSEVTAHVTAVIATVLLLVPVAYAMPSTIWWLTLVGFAMSLMSNQREARLWALTTIFLVAAVPLLEPMLRIAGSAGELEIEANMARTVFAVILFVIAYAFRREIERKTSDLIALAADLQAANAAKDRFLAHMGHELRTPLHGMLGMTEHALNQSLDEGQKRRLEAVRDSGTTLLRLLNDLLDIGRANADALTLDPQLFSLHETVAEVLPPYAAQALQRGLRFTATAAPDLRHRRIGDAARVRQIVLNLVSNALKFTRKGELTLRLEPWPEHADGVLLRVSDSGIGMPPGFAERVGQPFLRFDDRPTRAHGGAGLGLAIVCELARRMQGHVELESAEPGTITDHQSTSGAAPSSGAYRGGTTVSVFLRLPLATDDATAGEIDLLQARSLRAEWPAPSLRVAHALRILVCEDDALGRELMAATLTALGHTFELANDGAAGLTLATQDPFDLVLSDIEMPNLDGYAFLRQLREFERTQGRPLLPVIAVTAHAGPQDRARFLGLGFNDYLAKPFTLADLQRMLASVSITITNPTSSVISS